MNNALCPFGFVLRSGRIKKGLLLGDMARDTGISVSTISSIETGDITASAEQVKIFEEFFAKKGLIINLSCLVGITSYESMSRQASRSVRLAQKRMKLNRRLRLKLKYFRTFVNGNEGN